MRDGQKIGEWKYYHFKDSPYRTTKVLGYGNYKNGELVGLFKRFYKNGNLETIGNFNNNSNETGEWKYYYENGKVEAAGNYIDGIETGTWKSYNENGNLIESTKFINGKEQ